MRKLSTSQLLTGIAIISMAGVLASCGGGGGGGGGGASTPSSSSIPTSSSSIPVSSSSINPSISGPAINIPIYSDTYYYNDPIVTIYIDGQPVKLVLDSAASGMTVDASVVNIPSSDINASQTWSVTYGGGQTSYGVMASATVCANPSITQSCVVMPIGLIQGGNAFPKDEAQGNFGTDNGNYGQAVNNAYSYNYYLMQQNPYYNAFSLSFYPLPNGYWAPYGYYSATTPIGDITIDNANNFTSSTTIPYYAGLNDTFGSDTNNFVFDTGTWSILLPSSDVQSELTGSLTSYLGNCSNSSYMQGGVSLSFIINNNTFSFTTEPTSNSACDFQLMEGLTDINTQYSLINIDDFGLAYILAHQFIWYLDPNPQSNNYGFVYQLGIN